MQKQQDTIQTDEFSPESSLFQEDKETKDIRPDNIQEKVSLWKDWIVNTMTALICESNMKLEMIGCWVAFINFIGKLFEKQEYYNLEFQGNIISYCFDLFHEAYKICHAEEMH